jgi:OOP family OmpA-OmpF porin
MFLLAPAAFAASGDVKGGKDYPGIGLFGGSVITGYQAKDFDAVKLQAATFKSGKPTDAPPRRQGNADCLPHRTGALDPRGVSEFRDAACQSRL